MLTRTSNNPIWNQGQKKSSKNISWNKGKIANKEFSFSGFHNSNQDVSETLALRTENPIEFGEFLKINFLLFIPLGLTDGSAVLDLDLDLNGNSKDFVSMLIGNHQIHTTFTNGQIKTVFSENKIANEWIYIDIVLTKRSLTINMPKKTSYYFEFDRDIIVSHVSFGNNEKTKELDQEHYKEFLVKDINIETEYFKLV